MNTKIICLISAAILVASLGAHELASTQSRIDEMSADIAQLRNELGRLAAPAASTTAATDDTMNYLFAEVAELRRAIDDRSAAPPASGSRSAAPAEQATVPVPQPAADPAPESDALRVLKSRMLVTPDDWQEIDASVVAMSREENREFWHQLGEALAGGEIQLIDPQARASGGQPR